MSDTRTEARADAAAAKARAKALRPWYRKKRFILPAVLVIMIIVATIAGGDSETNPTTVASSSAETGTKSVQAAGSHPAEDDVALDACEADETGYWVARLTITNNSSKQSNYIVSLNLEDAAGVKIGEGTAASNNIDPGQSAKEDALFLEKASGSAVCKVKSVTRYASAG